MISNVNKQNLQKNTKIIQFYIESVEVKFFHFNFSKEKNVTGHFDFRKSYLKF